MGRKAHSLLVIQKITETIQTSNPLEYHWSFNFKRMYFFLKNGFPRGRAKAPGVVIPSPNLTADQLMESITKTKLALASLHHATARQYFTHPFFGDLNLKPAIWFLKLHTKHHLKIIEDILK